MIDVNINNVKELLTNNHIVIATVYPKSEKHHFQLMSSVSITLSDYSVITMQKGFKFDGSSSPQLLWWLFPSYGDFLFAALIHDWMYRNDYLRDKIGIELSREYADDEMLIWSDVLNGGSKRKFWDNDIRHKAVRIFGKKAYKK